jgi:hypothetical protein
MAGCASAPKSLIDGNPGHAADASLFPVRIVSVDGQLLFKPPNDTRQDLNRQRSTGGFQFPGTSDALQRRIDQTKLEMAEGFQTTPGTHEVVAQFANMQKLFVMTIKPCTAYHLGARYHARPSDWVLDATNTEPVGGDCNPDEEIRKAAEAKPS